MGGSLIVVTVRYNAEREVMGSCVFAPSIIPCSSLSLASHICLLSATVTTAQAISLCLRKTNVPEAVCGEGRGRVSSAFIADFVFSSHHRSQGRVGRGRGEGQSDSPSLLHLPWSISFRLRQIHCCPCTASQSLPLFLEPFCWRAGTIGR